MALRFRLATEEDIEFLRILSGVSQEGAFCSGTNGLTTEKEESVFGYGGFIGALAFTLRKTKVGEDGKLRRRVKPGPDPARPEETKYLCDKELRKEAYNSSTNWIESGSGNLGKVFVEVIECNGLPNFDTGEALGNKTDSFCTVVYEDSILQTEVIYDALSPLWMSWTQRAFAFNRSHPCSPLFLGIFDYDFGE